MHFQHLSKIALAISVAFLSAGVSAESNQVYSETVSGHNAPMTVDVIMKDGAIKNILVDDRESPGAGKKAIAILKKQILENQTVNLDAVTGATITSSSFCFGRICQPQEERRRPQKILQRNPREGTQRQI